MRILSLTALALLPLASCSGGNEDSGEPSTDPSVQSREEQTAVETLTAIPAAYQGRWDFSEQDCAADVSEMRLTIGTDSVRFYESSGAPQTITRTGPRTLTMEQRFSGEGDQWDETLGYELSEDGDRLTVTTADGSMSIRMRCPAE